MTRRATVLFLVSYAVGIAGAWTLTPPLLWLGIVGMGLSMGLMLWRGRDRGER